MSSDEIIGILRTMIIAQVEPDVLGKVAMSLIDRTTISAQPAKTFHQISPNITTTEPMPQQTVLPAGSVMIPAGFSCECDLCKKVVYRIKSDVMENMKKKDFVECFEPLGEAPVLAMPLDTFADSEGNLAIDCPLCKGTKSLWIKGKGNIPFNDIPENIK